jgi:subtilisin family serine protease
MNKMSKQHIAKVFLCAFVAITFSLNSFSATPEARVIKMDARTASDLDAQFRQSGSARIIIELETELEPDANLPPGLLKTPEKSARYSEAIARLQEKLLNKIQGNKGVKKFKNLPAIAMEVTAADLEELRLQEDVLSIREDILLEPLLDASAPQIGVDNLWALGYTGLGQAVAVLDTGVDSAHPVLAGKVVAEACFSTQSSTVTSLCPNGAEQQFGAGAAAHCSGSSCKHGTHVSGIAAGSDSNYSGVAPDADIIAIQVFSLMGNGSLQAYFSDVLKALDWLYDQRGNFSIASANLSLGGGMYTQSCDTAYSSFTSMVKTLRSEGIATVAAAGNNSYSNALLFPACINDVVSVGAVTGTDTIANFSNTMDSMNLLAPGTGIKSAVPGGGFASWSGTSMATPHVAGAFAVLRSAVPSASVTDILTALVDTGVPVTDAGTSLTFPRIAVDRALAALTGEDLVEPPPPGPEVRITVGTTDTGEYGSNFGSNEHATELSATFQSTGADLELSVTGFDIDTTDEIKVYLNGAALANLSAGPGDAMNAGDSFLIPMDKQGTGENRLRFATNNTDGKWGVAQLGLAEVEPPSLPPPPADAPIELVLGETDLGQYGTRYGSGPDLDVVAMTFDSPSQTLWFSVTGYDIGRLEPIQVVLNGVELGLLSRSKDGQYNDGDVFQIDASLVIDGANELLIIQTREGRKWGVTDLLVSASGDPESPLPPPVDGAIELTLGEIDLGHYGTRYGSGPDLDEVVLSFNSPSQALWFSVTGYDVGRLEPIQVVLNGVELGLLSRSKDGQYNDGDVFQINADLVNDGANVLQIIQTRSGRKWGVTKLLVSP